MQWIMYGSHYKLVHPLCVEVLHNILQTNLSGGDPEPALK